MDRVEPERSRWLEMVAGLALLGVLVALLLFGFLVYRWLFGGHLSPEEERNQRISCELQGGYWNDFYDKCYMEAEAPLP
jgi:hypothetical protein